MAIEPKYVELMNAEIDGEISDADRADLERHLETNPDAVTMHAELAELCGTLDDMGQMDPPPHLKYAILDSLKTSDDRATRKSSGFDWRAVFAAPVLHHTVTFAAGAFLTFALVSSNQLSSDAFDDVTGLVGTISETTPKASSKNSIRLTSSVLAGMVSLSREGSLNVVDFNLKAEGPVEIVASFSDRDLWFKGFAQLENDNTRILSDEGQVSMHTQGRNRYALYLQHTSEIDAPVNFKFYAAGSLIHEADLVISTEGEETE